MMHDTWKRGHKEIARKAWAKEKSAKRSRLASGLPQVPTDILGWINKTRPTVEGSERSFLLYPFWEEIYKDDSPSKMIMGGRQVFKSTYITDILAFEATSRPSAQVGYVTFNQISQTAFSRQKLMVGTFSQNPVLAQFPRNRTGNVGEISLKNGSTIYCTISGDSYRNIEGKSLSHCILDEAQYQPMEEAQRVVQTMMATKGKLTIAGIGGESGSAYENFWEMSDQREWVYDDIDWRKKLQFDGNGLVVGPYLKDLLAGRWVVQKNDNAIFHGYHIPQTLFATIPLTIDDSVLRYRTSPMYSIEYQKKNNPESFFATNVMGEFYRSDARPVTREMILACMTPYSYLGFSRPEEVLEYKDLFQERIHVAMGVDFGSGHASSTVIAIIVQWTLSDGQKRLHLAYLEKRSAENQQDQAEYICKLFKAYGCDVGVGDLGYGAIQVKIIQDGGSNRETGKGFGGVGSEKFLGCRTISDETRPLRVFDSVTDEHGDMSPRVEMDKTSAIQGFIDMLESRVVHPLVPEKSVPRLMIPSKAERHVDFLLRDCTAITRRDISRSGNVVDPRQRARREFNHPRDSVMAIIYATKALEIEQRWGYVSV